MLYLKQSTSATLKIGPFLDEDDGKTAETGLTIAQADVRLSKNGGNMAQKNEATSCTHDEIGVYDCPIDTTDTNTLGRLQLFVHESGALPVYHECIVIPANEYDSLISGSDDLEVDATKISGDSTAADNAELAFDGTGYGFTSCTMPTVTDVTTKTGYALSASGIDDILDEIVEGTLTMRQILRLALAALCGKSAGGGTVTLTFRDNADGKDRITATVDAGGNRTAVTLDES